MEPDVDAACKTIREVQPTVALFGQSVFLFPTPLEEMANAAKEVGASVMYDGAHVLGLIAGGQFQDPLREGADLMTGSSHKTFPDRRVDFCCRPPRMKPFTEGSTTPCSRAFVPPTTCTTLQGRSWRWRNSWNTVKPTQRTSYRTLVPLGALAAEGFDVLAESRGYTASHQVLTRHGELDSGAGAKAAQRLEEAGIITNMNMLPGDTKAMTPSGLRLGVQELTRVGFSNDDMEEVASFYARVLLHGEDPAAVRADVHALSSNGRPFATVSTRTSGPATPSERVMQWVENPTVCIKPFPLVATDTTATISVMDAC